MKKKFSPPVKNCIFKQYQLFTDMFVKKTVILLITFFICIGSYAQQSVATRYKIDKSLKQDSTVISMLSPYKKDVDIELRKVIGFSVAGLYKRSPEGNLGNFLADCMLVMAKEKTAKNIDASFVNPGIIRSYISKGDITKQKIYDVVPYDNVIVIQEIKGNVLRTFLDGIANSGGWPLSGISMQIKDKKATNIFITGRVLDDSATYTIAGLDYMPSNDEYKILQNSTLQNTGYLYRDAIIQYIFQLTESGKPIDSKIENRITYAD